MDWVGGADEQMGGRGRRGFCGHVDAGRLLEGGMVGLVGTWVFSPQAA